MRSNKGVFNYFPYSGNKFNFIDEISSLLDEFKVKEYEFIEPFGGSGIISRFISTSKNVKCWLNEIDGNIFKIHTSFKNGEFYELKDTIDEIYSLGDPKNNKDDYYRIRKILNEKYFNNDKYEVYKKGFYLWAISTFAINSMIRFGKTGPNQGWGNRGDNRLNPCSVIEKNLFDSIKDSYKFIELTNLDYKDIILNLGCLKNIVIFVDPPYVKKNSGTYKFNDIQHDELIDIIKSLNFPILYTDIYSDKLLEILGKDWGYKILRENIGIGKVGAFKKLEKECIYFNFKKRSAKRLF